MSQKHKSIDERCRLILIAPCDAGAQESLKAAFSGGDVASVIIPTGELNELEYADHVEKLVPIIQENSAAALVMKDTQSMGRSNADGIFIGSNIDTLLEIKEKFHPKKIVGFGGAKNKHNSMVAGDVGPDFMFYGKVDGDIKPEAHPKNVDLAHWWSQMVEIPCVVMAGSQLESVADIAASGAEFVAASKAVFGAGDAKENVEKINALLEEHSPVLELED